MEALFLLLCESEYLIKIVDKKYDLYFKKFFIILKCRLEFKLIILCD